MLFRSNDTATTEICPYLSLIGERIAGGSLAELLMDDWRDSRDLPAIMDKAATCLSENTPYRPG